MGTNRAALIKLCLTSFVDYLDRSGSKVSLPLDFSEILARNDGRTLKSKAASMSDPKAGRPSFNSKPLSDAQQAAKKLLGED